MSAVIPTSETTAAPAAATPKKKGMLGLLAHGVVMAALVAGSIYGMSVVIPDGNDYAQASNLKHAALATTAPKKVVLVGGSNLAFGIDSTIISKETRCPVVNMGMNGYFGVRFMLNEVKPDLKAGDIVVIALEYDSFYKSVDGSPFDLLMVTKSNPSTFKFLSAGQQMQVLERYPQVAQEKAFKLMDEVHNLSRILRGQELEVLDPEVYGPDISKIETVKGFTKDGDLTSHLGLKWKQEREDGIDITHTPLDPGIIPLLRDFAAEMKKRDVHLMISWSPIIEDFYGRHKAEVDRLSAVLGTDAAFRVPSPASAFVFPESQHFDTVYHLNEIGREIRSKRVADDILKTFGAAGKCDGAFALKETSQ